MELGGWATDDSVIMEHIRTSSDCPLITCWPTSNIPLNHELLSKRLPPKGLFFTRFGWGREGEAGVAGGATITEGAISSEALREYALCEMI